MGTKIELDTPVVLVPATEEVTGGLIGIVGFSARVDKDTGKFAATFTPCKASATVWAKQNDPEVSSDDLVSEFLDAQGNPTDMEALGAIQAVEESVKVICKKLLIKRGAGVK